jgi:cell division protein FtsQ
VLSARLERPKLGSLRIAVEERQVIAHLESHPQQLGLSADGVLLKGAPQKGPQIASEVDFPITQMVQVVRAFPYAERIRYNRAGFSVEGPGVKVWGSAQELQKIAKGETMVGSALRNKATTAQGKGSQVFVYSWGVSKRR